MNVWEKLHEEPRTAYSAFLFCLESNPRPTNAQSSERANLSIATILEWKTKFNWAERMEAYDRWVAETSEERREAILKESAYKLQAELFTNIRRLLVENAAYIEKLTQQGGLQTLKDLDIHELRNNANENLELLAKLIKPYKEILIMTPEGKKLLSEEIDAGEQVIINIHPAIPKTIEAEKVEIIEHKTEDNAESTDKS